MRRARRTDGNHSELRKLFRQLGCVFEDTSDVGRGFPDALVRLPDGRVRLVEIKDGSKPPSARKLTQQEQEMATRWKDSYVVVVSKDDVVKLVTGSA